MLPQFIFTCGSSVLLRDAQMVSALHSSTTACFFKGCYTFLPSQLQFIMEEEHSTFQFCFFCTLDYSRQGIKSLHVLFKLSHPHKPADYMGLFHLILSNLPIQKSVQFLSVLKCLKHAYNSNESQ